MVALIPSLIDKQDSFEIVRDQIALILLEESAAQKVFATAASKDPRLFALRVFIERDNPWAEYQDGPTDALDATPIVNITFETSAAAKAAGNVVARQQFSVTYNIDCYGYGVAQADGASGHVAGDKGAALASQRAAKLVRNILMSAFYTQLGLPPGIVGTRWIQGITEFKPELDARPIQQVIGSRISFEVTMNEFAPQAEGEIIEVVGVTVFRAETGEVYLDADFVAP